jgi:hypothetical protein
VTLDRVPAEYLRWLLHRAGVPLDDALRGTVRAELSRR